MKNTRSRVKSSSDDEDKDEDWSPQPKLANKKRKRPVKKQKTPARKIAESDSENLEVQDDSPSVPVNTSGLPIFPDELLLEVMSHYPAIPLPTAKSESFDPEAHRKRRETLFALSQTCSNLRRFFRPYIWQRIEVVSGMWFPCGGYHPTDRLFNLELLRQLEIVTIRDPSLAEYVKVINVEVTKYSGNAVLAEVARCMALFSNLHTVKLQCLVKSDSKPLWIPSSTKFSQYAYPSVRSVIVSGGIFELVHSCPGVQWVHRSDDPRGIFCNYFVTVMLPSCSFLKNLELNLPVTPVTTGLQAIIKASPKVCTLKIHFTSQNFLTYQSQFSSLSKFKHLESLSMDVRTSINLKGSDVKEGVIMWAKKLLLELQQKDQKKKWIHMEYTRYSRGYTELKKVDITLPVPKPIGADDQE